MNNAYKPLTSEEFAKRITGSFPSVYLTIISIIQGVALGILASNSFGYVKRVGPLPHDWPLVLIYTVFSLLLIILVSFEYTWFIGVFQWSPTFWDALVPIVLGFTEVGPMFFLDRPRVWWLLTAFFCLAGAGGYLNSLLNCKEEMFGGNRQAYELTRGDLRTSFRLSLSGMVVCVIASWLAKSLGSSWQGQTWFLLPLSAYAFYMLQRGNTFLKRLHRVYGFGK